jgi:predicted N-acetyltransferase YhbS
VLIEGTGAYTTTYSAVAFNGFEPLALLRHLTALFGNWDMKRSFMTATPSPLRSNPGADVAVRDALLDRAMAPNWKKKTSGKLRAGRLPAEGLAFVARDNRGGIVGTVRLWNIQAGIDAVGRPVPALLLGPLAVDPDAKSRGTGSLLMRHALSEAARLGHGAVLLVGDAPYYARFGFTAKIPARWPCPARSSATASWQSNWSKVGSTAPPAWSSRRRKAKARNCKLVA